MDVGINEAREKNAIKAMITIKSERLWGILDSILESGYLNTENIIVQKDKDGELIVKEGNRRIAALKWVLGIHNVEEFDVPKKYATKISELSKEWKKENSKIVALIFDASEDAATVTLYSRTSLTELPSSLERSSRSVTTTVKSPF